MAVFNWYLAAHFRSFWLRQVKSAHSPDSYDVMHFGTALYRIESILGIVSNTNLQVQFSFEINQQF